MQPYMESTPKSEYQEKIMPGLWQNPQIFRRDGIYAVRSKNMLVITDGINAVPTNQSLPSIGAMVISTY